MCFSMWFQLREFLALTSGDWDKRSVLCCISYSVKRRHPIKTIVLFHRYFRYHHKTCTVVFTSLSTIKPTKSYHSTTILAALAYLRVLFILPLVCIAVQCRPAEE